MTWRPLGKEKFVGKMEAKFQRRFFLRPPGRPKKELKDRNMGCVPILITINPDVCEGKPTIRNLRITVDFILKLLGDAYNADEIVKNYPEMEKEDVYQAAKYGTLSSMA